MPAFDPTKPYQTRDGRAARVICTDRKSSLGRTLHGLVYRDQDNTESPQSWFPNGRVHLRYEHARDLVNIDEFAKPGRDIVELNNGLRAWLFTREANGNYPIMGQIEGSQSFDSWTAKGNCRAAGTSYYIRQEFLN
jgi:hypothetical protein